MLYFRPHLGLNPNQVNHLAYFLLRSILDTKSLQDCLTRYDPSPFQVPHLPVLPGQQLEITTPFFHLPLRSLQLG